jgi:cytochrome b561
VDPLPLIAGSSIAGLDDWDEVIVWLANPHALAAIYQYVKLKDGVLQSMVPWLRSR